MCLLACLLACWRGKNYGAVADMCGLHCRMLHLVAGCMHPLAPCLVLPCLPRPGWLYAAGLLSYPASPGHCLSCSTLHSQARAAAGLQQRRQQQLPGNPHVQPVCHATAQQRCGLGCWWHAGSHLDTGRCRGWVQRGIGLQQLADEGAASCCALLTTKLMLALSIRYLTPCHACGAIRSLQLQLAGVRGS